MKVTPEKVGVTIPLTAAEREFAHLWAGEWNVEFTEGFKALSKEVETTTARRTSEH